MIARSRREMDFLLSSLLADFSVGAGGAFDSISLRIWSTGRMKVARSKVFERVTAKYAG